MLEIKNFSKVYSNGKVGAKNINLSVESGDIFAFIGHNGAGKTTTIKSIVGILQVTEGDILIDGVSIKNNPIFRHYNNRIDYTIFSICCQVKKDRVKICKI